MNILITGGTGLVGKLLATKLKEKGHTLLLLSRSKKQISYYDKTYVWDYTTDYIEEEAVLNADYIIHLAGANIASDRWTNSRKKEIIESRTLTTKLLIKVLEKHNHRLKGFISASAVGFYGAITNDKLYTEADTPTDDFLGNSCVAWEKSAEPMRTYCDQVSWLRLGIVLDKKEGAYPKLMQPIRFGLGAVIGNGKQYFPWVHGSDVVNAFIHVLENPSLNGVFNVVAPSITNLETFTTQAAQAVGSAIRLPSVPAFVLKTVLGEMSEMLLQGVAVSSTKLINTGFTFQYTEVGKAVTTIEKG